MPKAITPSLRASLEKLKHAGSVNGICLAWRRQVLVSLMPFEDFRVEQVVQTVSDAREHFQSNGERQLDSLWMGFADVNAMAIFAGELTVIVLHSRPEESDFINGVIKTFLNDAQLTIASVLSPPAPEEKIEEEETSTEEENDDLDGWLADTPEIDPNRTNLIN